MAGPATAPEPGRFFTRGQPAAVEAVRTMLGRGMPHAILLVGPPSSGKATLARDIAAALLCTAADPAERPCGSCRGCRLVAGGNHPDLHRLAPEGAGRQIAIGDPRSPEPGTVRHLVGELALLPVEGGARVAVVEEAVRLNEDAQNALLKTLEEPPAGVTIVLCVDDEDRLLPTVRSRCARVRLGPVAVRDIEAILGERDLADPPTAARLARMSGGRPGLAVALARAPEAVAARQEIARSLLDALGDRRAARLALVRELVARAGQLAAALDDPAAGGGRLKGRRGGKAGAAAGAGATGVAAAAGTSDSAGVDAAPSGDASDASVPPDGVSDGPGKVPASERRRAALMLVAIWRDVARDLAIVARGGRAVVRDPGLLEELEAGAAGLDPAILTTFLERIDRTARLLEGNANPELALDVLVLAWRRPQAGSDA